MGLSFNMSVQAAIQIEGPKKARLIYDRPRPKVRDGCILVKTVAVALNPTDWKHIDYIPTKGAGSGIDYAGTVEEVGPGVRKSFKKGDRVFGCSHGGNTTHPEDGAFAEYIVAVGDVQFHMPPQMTFEEASVMGAGLLTVAQGLYQSLELPLPSAPATDGPYILIYGGSTASGTMAIQFAKLSGWKVVSTASPSNFSLVRFLGADAVFDYKDVNCAQKIREFTKNELKYAFDCITEGPSLEICADALSTSPGCEFSGLLNYKKFPRDDVKSRSTLAYTALGEEFQQGPDGPIIPAKPEDFEYAANFANIAEKLVAEGKVKPHPRTLKPGGLGGIINGMNLLRQGKVSGEKLVYRIAETPPARA